MLLMLVAALPALTLLAYFSFRLAEHERAQMQAGLITQTRLLAVDYQEHIEEIRLLLDTLTLHPGIRALRGDSCTSLLAAVKSRSPAYMDNLLLVQPDGNVSCSALPIPPPGRSVADMGWFRQGIEASGFRVGDYHVSRASGIGVMNLTLPLRLDDRNIALLAASIDAARFNVALQFDQMPAGSHYAIVDKQGTIGLSYPEPHNWMGRNIAWQPLWSRLGNETDIRTFRADNLLGTPSLIAHTALTSELGGSGHVIMWLPITIADAPIQRIYTLGLAGLSAVILMGLTIGWLGGRQLVVRPLVPVLDTLRRVARGELGTRIGPLHSSEELDQLAHEVDSMAANLEAQDEALRTTLERSRKHLQAADAITHSEAMQAGDVNTLAYEITELVALISGVERASVWLFNGDGRRLTCIDLYEATPHQHSSGAMLAEAEFRSEFDSFRHAPYVASHDPLHDPRTAAYTSGYLWPLNITSLLDAVIRIADRQMGVLCLEHVGREHRWEQDEIAFACLLADRLALVLANRERRLAEEATRREHRQSQAYLDVVGVMVVALDRQGNVTLINRKACELLGYGEDACAGAAAEGGPCDWFRDHLPDSIAEAQAAVYRLAMDGRVELAPYAEYPVRAAGGEQRLIAWHNALLRDEAGGIVGCLSAGQDITDNRRIEAALLDSRNRFQSLVDNLPGTVFRCTASHPRMVQHVSPAVLGLTGIPAERFMEGSLSGDRLIHEDDLERVKQAIAEGIARRQPYAVEYRLRHADGGLHTVEERGRAVFDADGRPRWLDGVIMDISERTRSAEEREQLLNQLQQAQKMEALGLLTGGIAHDFNNILASVLGFSKLALRRHAPDPASELAGHLREVIAAGERARDLIAKLLAFSRRQATLPARPLPPEPQVREIMRMLSATIPSSIEIENCFAADLPAIAVDPVDLQQILMNLVINARDAVADKGRIGIELARAHTEHAVCAVCHAGFSGEWLMLKVSDTGRGIPEAMLSRIFDPFFTTKEAGQGTGMGLAVVQGLVRRAGGHIGVTSVPGQGTSFSVYFPPAAETTEAPAAPATLPLAAPPRRNGRGRLLVVDDETAILRLLEQDLGGAGWQVSAHADPRQALEAFRRAPADYAALISDVTMPGMSGPELAAALRALRPNLPVILCTGHQKSPGLGEDLLRGVDRFFYKPVDTDELHGALTALCAPDSDEAFTRR
jgi:PAS domain S-box-containing protein